MVAVAQRQAAPASQRQRAALRQVLAELEGAAVLRLEQEESPVAEPV